MKKLIILLIGITAISRFAFAQSIEGRAEFDKTDYPAVVGEFAFTSDVVEDVIVADMKEKGFKKYNNKKGYMIFEGIQFTQISPKAINFYISIQEKKKEKEKTIVTFLLSLGLTNFIGSGEDPSMINNAKTYMNELAPKFVAKKLDNDIEAQQKVYDKAKKDYEKLISEGESLVKKKADIENDIVKNKADQEIQKALMDKENTNLQNLLNQKK
ncbi:MAG: hypothetical protein PHR81_07800 [Bacteroidales bacterium]|jgi:hypothetical protein|nr:hypothetical protein [Bacteroidales bacterium]MDD4214698.1 hypothetical protein [Bacteroidales bacterium]